MKNYTHAQYHQFIGSQIGRLRKKRFSVQCTGDLKTDATDYQRQQQQPTDAAQLSIAGFARPELTKQAMQLYDASSPRQQEIHNVIIKDLLIGCTLPLSNVGERH